MRRAWTVTVAALAAGLLGACTDPSSAPGAPPTSAAAPRPSATTHQRPAASPAPSPSVEPPTVLYLGDSLAVEAQEVLGRELRRQVRARYTAAPHSGTTLCDYLEGTGGRSLVPPRDKAATLVRALRPDYVVLQFWGNAWGYTPCMDGITHDAAPERYLERYAADARRLTEQIAEAGGDRRPRIVWVLQGPDPLVPDRVRRVNGIYERRAAASGDLVADAGRAVTAPGARHAWTRYVPCDAVERAHPDLCTDPARGRTALHRADDPLHFCLAPTTSAPRPCPVASPGVLRTAGEIARVVTEDAGGPG
ncbi:SGNH/GDSL hydrolase family protein [Streptomyces albogriseolus]